MMLTFLKSTIFSKSWWSKYYWIVVSFLVGIIILMISGSGGSPLGRIFKRLNKIEKKSRDKIRDIESESEKLADDIQEKSEIEKEKVRKETKEAVAKIKKELDTKSKSIAGDSNAIND